jgi:hypothetical protein
VLEKGCEVTRVTHRKVKPERLSEVCVFCLTLVKSSLDDVVAFPDPGHMVESMYCPGCGCMILFATDADVIYLKYPSIDTK